MVIFYLEFVGTVFYTCALSQAKLFFRAVCIYLLESTKIHNIKVMCKGIHVLGY